MAHRTANDPISKPPQTSTYSTRRVLRSVFFEPASFRMIRAPGHGGRWITPARPYTHYSKKNCGFEKVWRSTKHVIEHSRLFTCSLSEVVEFLCCVIFSGANSDTWALFQLSYPLSIKVLILKLVSLVAREVFNALEQFEYVHTLFVAGIRRNYAKVAYLLNNGVREARFKCHRSQLSPLFTCSRE